MRGPQSQLSPPGHARQKDAMANAATATIYQEDSIEHIRNAFPVSTSARTVSGSGTVTRSTGTHGVFLLVRQCFI